MVERLVHSRLQFPGPAHDVQAPLLSVPRILGMTLGTVPATVPYLSADKNLVEDWQSKLHGSHGFRVGIAWQGNPRHNQDFHRSIPLVEFAPLAQVEGVRLVSLQKGPGTEQLRHVAERFRITHWDSLDEEAGPFMDTAALMKNLDLVITSDTVTAHLAGALGVPVWVALPIAPDWRWLLEREDSPWYPSMRLFRQSERANWRGVFERIAGQLSSKDRSQK